MAGTYIISGTVGERALSAPHGLVVEWDQAKNKLLSVGQTRVDPSACSPS